LKHALAGPLILSAAAWGREKTPPSARIHVAMIGLGGRGMTLLNDFVMAEDARVVALCDVHRKHYRDNAWGEGRAFGIAGAQAYLAYRNERLDKPDPEPSVYSDFREVIAREDVDAVVVATPDHWHAFITLEALRHGKDVYCEKPVTHFFHEGQAVYREVAARKAVFQAGSQQRSDPRFRHAVEVVRNGHLGKIQRVEVGLPEGYAKPMGDAAVMDVPEGLDYDLWCGPSDVLPYMRARHHRWWRGHRAYGGGVLMDWIGHHNDIAHWALDLDGSGPTAVRAENWTFPETDIYNTPHQYALACTYADGMTSSISSQHPIGTKWIGEDGWLYVRRGEITASNPAWVRRSFDPGPEKVYASPGHARNFLDCVRSRAACVAPAETAHRSITPGHLGYVSEALGRELKWDPVREEVIDDAEANDRLRGATYRTPWHL
jgi:predicted dehydrogenase